MSRHDLDNVVTFGPAPVASVQGTLALDLQPRVHPPEPTVVAHGRPVADVTAIEAPLRHGLDGIGAILRDPDHLHVAGLAQDHAQPFRHDGLVVAE